MIWSDIVFYAVLWLLISVVVSLFLGAVIRRMGEDTADAPCAADEEQRGANDNRAAPAQAPQKSKCGASNGPG